MKRRSLFLLLLWITPLLCSCGAAKNPLERAEATPVPGLSMELHAATASENSTDEISVALYYRYLHQPMLAAESKAINVRRDETPELALIRALLEGPTAGHNELTRLFPESVRVENVSAQGDVLLVTFNESLLTDDGIPDDWAQQPAWVEEAPLFRELLVQSLVASVTESFSYTGVQIFVNQPDNAHAGQRLENTYFLTGEVGLSDPQRRDEARLLTAQGTANALLTAWQRRDYETLYAYTAAYDDSGARPVYDQFASKLDAGTSLESFSTSAGSVSENGSKAVLTVSLSFISSGENTVLNAYPLHLKRENSIWKMTYSSLTAMLLR